MTVLAPIYFFVDMLSAFKTSIQGLADPCTQLHVILKYIVKIPSLRTLLPTFLIQLLNTLNQEQIR